MRDEAACFSFIPHPSSLILPMMESYLMGTDQPTPARLRLRDLPLSARLVLSAFLISVGCGYFAALVQLHFQHASPGNAMPTRDDVVRVFYGPTGEKPK